MKIKNSNLVEILQARAEEQPNQTAFIFLEEGENEKERITYAQLDKKARQVAVYLQEESNSGERALLLFPMGLEFVSAFYGCMYAGIIPIPTNPPQLNRSALRLNAIVNDSEASLALTTPNFIEDLDQRFKQIPNLEALHWVDDSKVSAANENDWKKPDLSPDNLAFIQYTSGSTSTPRGVTISHKNVVHNISMVNNIRYLERGPDSVYVNWAPIFHDMGLILSLMVTVGDCFPAVMMSPIAFLQKPARWLKAITKYKGTFSGGPNFSYELLNNKVKPEECEGLDLSNWKMAFNSAEPIRPETQTRFAEKFSPYGFKHEAFHPCYGLAEATLVVTGYGGEKTTLTYPVDRAALEKGKIVASDKGGVQTQLLVNCGRPLGDMHVNIVNPETKERSADDEIGEIWVAGGSVTNGYWNREEDTEKLCRARIKGSDEGPFVRTGDLGFMRGNDVYVTGRSRDMIIIRGRNYYPQDIELTVQESHEALQPGGGASFGITIDGVEYLVVIHEVKREFRKYLDLDEVIKKIRFAIARDQGIRAYAVVLIRPYSLPKTSSGKVMRHAALEQFLDGELKIVGEWRANQMIKKEKAAR